MGISLRSIGVVRTTAETLPRHWSVSEVEGTLVVDADVADGLGSIRPGQKIVVLFHFDRSPSFTPDCLWQVSGATGEVLGVFSTCSPLRPNPIGLSVVEVIGVEANELHVRGLDMLDGTPILDIKPHIEAGP